MEELLNVNEITEADLEEVSGGAKTYYEIYVVKTGDNLSKIAKAYSTTWKKIYALNKAVIGPDPNLIRPGMKLKIPNDRPHN